MKHATMLAAALSVFGTVQPAAAETQGGIETERLGTVSFAISCPPDTRARFEVALALLHHMMYEQALATFDQLAQRTPDCAMAHWGVAMSLFHPLWPDQPTPQELERGQAAVERARQAGSPTARERAYIDAAAAYYQDWRTRPEGERLGHWSAALGRVHEAHPEDVDAAAFYALSILSTAPGDDPALAEPRRAAAILARAFERHPHHPGVVHYAIHAHDYPGLARAGVIYAEAYEAIAPAIPHAAHMPSHIYVRLGEWHRANQWNERSAAAARRFPIDGMVSHHWTHAADYLVYGYLQTLQDREARRVLAEMKTGGHVHPGLVSAYGVAAANVRYPLERHAWEEAAQLTPEQVRADLDWQGIPEARGVVVYARGLGAARSGRLDVARSARDELAGIAETLAAAARESPGRAWWAARAALHRDEVAAWIAFAEGDRAGAVEQMRAAARREDALGKNPVMPGYELPAWEQLGDMLLTVGDARGALEAFEASLRVSPNRINALHGAGMAARALNDTETATRYFGQLVETAAQADTPRPMLGEAQQYLQAHPPTL